MDPQCHPRPSLAQSEQDLRAEQDEFFISGSVNCVKLVGENVQNSSGTSNPVLNDVIERSASSIKPPQPPQHKAPLIPKKISASTADMITTKENSSCESIATLKDKISHENDEKLSKMSAEEIEALKVEVFESIPESFLDLLRNKD